MTVTGFFHLYQEVVVTSGLTAALKPLSSPLESRQQGWTLRQAVFQTSPALTAVPRLCRSLWPGAEQSGYLHTTYCAQPSPSKCAGTAPCCVTSCAGAAGLVLVSSVWGSATFPHTFAQSYNEPSVPLASGPAHSLCCWKPLEAWSSLEMAQWKCVLKASSSCRRPCGAVTPHCDLETHLPVTLVFGGFNCFPLHMGRGLELLPYYTGITRDCLTWK